MDYKKDYYSILGVDSKATIETLRTSYRRLAKLHHPDKNSGDLDADERFKSINEAYEILSNEITRQIYDSYRANNKNEDRRQDSDENDNSANSYVPFTRKKKRAYKVAREKRVYVHGTIEVKFQGDPELSDNYLRQREQRFTISPTEVLVTIISSDIYKDAPPKEYQQGYSTTELFTTPLKQPINCKIVTAGQEEFYELDLYDIRIKDAKLKDITRYEQFSFGTLQGNLFSYALYQYEEEGTEEFTEYYGPTGHVETKTESSYVFSRQQFYATDGSTYWTAWKRGPGYTKEYQAKKETAKPIFQNDTHRRHDWLWLLLLLIMVAVYPPLLYVVFPLFILWLIILIFGGIVSAFGKRSPVSGILGIVLIALIIAGMWPHGSGRLLRPSSNNPFDSISSKSTVIQRPDEKPDTIISHNLRWEDRDSQRFEIQLSVPSSGLHRSTLAHELMDEQQYSLQGISAVYRFMLDTDNEYTKSIARAFDSLAKLRLLDKQREASMVVSCIQSIPYSLVVDRSCSANYADDYISQYLAKCQGDCCKGYSKFGVQSPVEFIGDLKGDCDTRALLLYDILGKLGYKVALMTSNYYKHAVVAVKLDQIPSDQAIAAHIAGRPYYLWETTSKGFGPGELPGSLSNMNHWSISLSQ